MIRLLLVPAAIIAATPAMAQQAAPQQPAAPDQAAPAQSAPGQSTPAQPAPAQSGDAVASIVNSEFPAYDQNNDGQLDKAEFTRWMVALKDQEMKATGKTLSPAEVSTWADGAFTTADTDKSATVSKPELIAYLSGGAA